MRNLVYDVAMSLDGFIAGPGGDVSRFLSAGDHVDAYFARLAAYDTTVMGRATYEFGYAFGMAPGARAYPHMTHHIYSRTLELPADSQVEVVRDDAASHVAALKATDGGDIYLCGGGRLAGALLAAGLIDRLIVKLNPILLGEGVPLFDGARADLTLLDSRRYESGVVLLTYDVSAGYRSAARPR